MEKTIIAIITLLLGVVVFLLNQRMAANRVAKGVVYNGSEMRLPRKQLLWGNTASAMLLGIAFLCVAMWPIPLDFTGITALMAGYSLFTISGIFLMTLCGHPFCWDQIKKRVDHYSSKMFKDQMQKT